MELFMLLDNLALISSVPMTLYENEKVLYQPLVPPYLELALSLTPDELTESEREIGYVQKKNLLFGFVRIDESKRVLLGPVAETGFSTQELYTMLEEAGALPADTPKLQQYFDMVPQLWRYQFTRIVSFAAVLLGKPAVDDINELRIDVPEEEKAEDVSGVRSIPTDTLHGKRGYEDALFSCVKYGLVDKLQTLLNESQSKGTPGKLAADSLRSHKNLLIVAIALAERAAISGGLEHETALNLGDAYIRQLERAKNDSQIRLLKDRFFQKITQLVSFSRTGMKNTVITNKVAKYVQAHIDQRVTVTKIADALGISEGHLCAQFKKDSGMTVNEYIQRVKINSAKELLVSSEKTISQIAYELGFSSQSYFQTSFRNQCGMTPRQYREEKKNSLYDLPSV